MDDEALDLLLKRDVPCVPALYFEKASVELGQEFGLSQKVIDGHQETLDGGIESARRILRAGGRLGMGGDYGFGWNPHGDYARELTFFVKDVGLTPLEVITCATKTGAEIMGGETNLYAGERETRRRADRRWRRPRRYQLARRPEEVHCRHAGWHYQSRGACKAISNDGETRTMNQVTQHSHGSPSLRYVDHGGEGSTLLLLHGVTRCGEDWEPLLSTLTSQWRVIALDQRGHGGSERANSYLVTDYVGDAVRLVRDELSTPTTIFGHSLGAMVASRLQRKYRIEYRASFLKIRHSIQWGIVSREACGKRSLSA